MTYRKHLTLSLKYSKLLFIASIKAIIHAFLPNLFITSTSNTIIKINELIKINNCNSD